MDNILVTAFLNAGKIYSSNTTLGLQRLKITNLALPQKQTACDSEIWNALLTVPQKNANQLEARHCTAEVKTG